MKTDPDLAIARWRGTALMGYALLALTFGLGGVWAAMAPLNSAVIAPGVLAVESNRQTVQHLEGGIVREILVRDGDKVVAGQVLFRLDGTQAKAVLATLDNQRAVARITEARLIAERDGAASISVPDEIKVRMGEATLRSAIADETANFRQRRTTLLADVSVIEQRVQQAKSQIEGATSQSQSLRRQIASIDKELPGLRALLKKGLTPVSRVSALERQREEFTAQREGHANEIARSKILITELEGQIDVLRQSFQKTVAAELVENRKLIAELDEKLKVAADQSQRIEILSPHDGIVQGMKIVTLGAVVRPGEPLLDIAPDNEALIVKVEIAPEDIEQMYLGLDAEVQLVAFLQARMPIIKGKLTRLSNDRLVSEATPERKAYYAGEVTLDLATLPNDVREKLRAGMPTSTMIATGARTVLDYLVGPILYRLKRGMTEE
jgi:HlyD family type I secretion membrane fusion protein